MEFSKRMKLFGDEIFAALNDKKVALEAQGRTIYNLSVGTPDFAPRAPQRQGADRRGRRPRKLEVQPAGHPPRCSPPSAATTSAASGWTSPPDQVASCNGSQEGCGHIGMVLCDEGDTVLLPNPCYPVFIAGAKLAGAVPYYYPLVKEHNFLPYVKDIPEDVARRGQVYDRLPARQPRGQRGQPRPV